MHPSVVRHTFGFPLCQRLWDLTNRRDDIVVANMVADMVANMEVDKMADIVADMGVDKMVATWWFLFLSDFFLNFSVTFLDF